MRIWNNFILNNFGAIVNRWGAGVCAQNRAKSTKNDSEAEEGAPPAGWERAAGQKMCSKAWKAEGGGVDKKINFAYKIPKEHPGGLCYNGCTFQKRG